MKEKVLLGMSGGTDSSVSAMMLLEQGYDVSGVTFLFHTLPSGEKAVDDASALCKKLGIEHFTIDARKEFSEKILNYFRDEYLAGRTPFPCAVCNRDLKWNLIFREAEKTGCSKVAMGHYAKIIREDGRFFIGEGTDPDKDQSFFLWGINREFLPNIIFPLGDFYKKDVRKMAGNYGFPSLEKKKDSLGACFCEGDYRPLLKQLSPDSENYFKPGNFIDEDGKILGIHQGYPLYTVGQRRGLGIHLNKAVFVKNIQAENNEITLAPLKNMYRNHFMVKDYHIVDAGLFGNDFDTDIRIRYRKQNNKGRITILDEKHIRIELSEPLESIAPGQTAVFYREGLVLGGGFIE
jgi:tRNA-specific 2-thiouridylase